MLYPFLIIMNILFILFLIKSKNNLNYVFVSAIYAGVSKHSTMQYSKWIKSFSDVVNKNLYIFCNKKGYTMLNKKLQKFVKFNNNIFDLEKIKNYELVYKRIWNIDPEKNYHTYRLYGIWNGKISMLKYVAERIKSKLYIWIDIGSNRENKNYSVFPSNAIIKYLHNITKHNFMFFFLMNNFPRLNKSLVIPLSRNYIQGGSFGGSKEGIFNYFKEFFSLHDYFLSKNLFVGKDQTLYNSIAYFNLSKVILLKYKSDKCKNDKWFRFYDFYANEKCAETNIY